MLIYLGILIIQKNASLFDSIQAIFRQLTTENDTRTFSGYWVHFNVEFTARHSKKKGTNGFV